MTAIRTDEMRDRIAAYPFPCGGVEVVRASRGYTLYSRRTDGPVARLRPTGEGDEVQVLWWRGQAWDAPGDFGPLIMPLDQALEFIATTDFFWINAWRRQSPELCKVQIGTENALRLRRSFTAGDQ
jgi:hypothetical protein